MLFPPNSVLREKIIPGAKERGQINFPNYASQLQTIFARSKGTKILKQLTITATFIFLDRTNQT